MNNTILTVIVGLTGPLMAIFLSTTGTPWLPSVANAAIDVSYSYPTVNDPSIKETTQLPTRWISYEQTKILESLDSEKSVTLSYRQKWKKDFNLSDCRITQTEDQHSVKWNWSMYAMDIACIKWQSFKVFSPKYSNVREYTVTHKWYTTAMWTYITLSFVSGDVNYSIIYGHTTSTLNPWQTVQPWVRIWNTAKNWISTAVHLHAELRQWFTNLKFDFKTVNPNSKLIVTQRWRDKVNQSWFTKQSKFYFTHYDLHPEQTDGNPCWWAAWPKWNLCDLQKNGVKFMALTKDIRDLHWISFGNKVSLKWDKWCAWTFIVLDEMNCRFRWKPCYYSKNGKWNWHPTGNTLRPWTNYFIKWDIVWMPWWVCTVTKL